MQRSMSDNIVIQDRQAQFAREAREARLHQLAKGARPASPTTGVVLRGRFDRLGAAVRGLHLPGHAGKDVGSLRTGS